MIEDCHTHISCPAMDEQGLADKLASQGNVDKCIVLASCGESADEVNSQVARFVEKYPERMVGFAFIDPTKVNVTGKYLNNLIKKQDFKGIVLYCGDSGFHPAHTWAMRLYEAAQEANLPVFFHNGGETAPGAAMEYVQPYLLDEIAREFDSLKIVIGSMGVPFVDQTMCMVGKHANVYADLTFNIDRPWQLYNMIMAAHECKVLDKLLLGSGFPFGNIADCIEALLGFNKRLGDANLPTVPRGELRHIVERDTLSVLGIE